MQIILTLNGSGTTASYEAAHSEGENTTASNLASHSEGINTTSSGTGSHSEGRKRHSFWKLFACRTDGEVLLQIMLIKKD